MIANNTIKGFSQYGIYVYGGGAPTVVGNTISGNPTGIRINTPSTGIYHQNIIFGNTANGIFYSGTAVIDATNNYWGHPTGPLDDSDDRASDHVNYTPWTEHIVITPGDINLDGAVDLTNVVLALQIMAGTIQDQTVFQDADVNNDGQIGMEEAIYLMEKVAGMRD